MMRLQRRPLKKQHHFENLKTVRTLRDLDPHVLGTLLKLAQTISDGVGRSIFYTNFREIMKNSSKVVFRSLNIKTPLFGVRGVEKKILGILQSWIQNWREHRIQAVVTTRLVAAAAPSLIGRLDSTPTWSDKAEEEAV